MEINMKKYELRSFQDKDIYTWDEIIDIIWGLECDLEEERFKNGELEGKIRELQSMVQYEPDYDPYDTHLLDLH